MLECEAPTSGANKSHWLSVSFSDKIPSAAASCRLLNAVARSMVRKLFHEPQCLKVENIMQMHVNMFGHVTSLSASTKGPPG